MFPAYFFVRDIGGFPGISMYLLHPFAILPLLIFQALFASDQEKKPFYFGISLFLSYSQMLTMPSLDSKANVPVFPVILMTLLGNRLISDG